VCLADVAADQGPVLGSHAAATISAGGKRLRPLLVLLAAGSADDLPRRSLVRAAAAVELVHVATLVHDDVLDNAALRRGAPTVFASAGRAAAIQTGDALFAAAFLLLCENENVAQVQALARAGSALAAGELLQRADAWNTSISVDRYLERCGLKTARLFEAACAIGAAARGEDPAPLVAYAYEIGLAFQILDDVLDVEGPPERTGKHRGTDLLDGTVTLPFLLARRELGELDLRTVTTPAEAESLCAQIIASGATHQARDMALGHVARAKALIPRSDPGRAAALELLAESVVARYS
jgi:geranylgeranyl pyrophosphate synthase